MESHAINFDIQGTFLSLAPGNGTSSRWLPRVVVGAATAALFSVGGLAACGSESTAEVIDPQRSADFLATDAFPAADDPEVKEEHADKFEQASDGDHAEAADDECRLGDPRTGRPLPCDMLADYQRRASQRWRGYEALEPGVYALWLWGSDEPGRNDLKEAQARAATLERESVATAMRDVDPWIGEAEPENFHTVPTIKETTAVTALVGSPPIQFEDLNAAIDFCRSREGAHATGEGWWVACSPLYWDGESVCYSDAMFHMYFYRDIPEGSINIPTEIPSPRCESSEFRWR